MKFRKYTQKHRVKRTPAEWALKYLWDQKEVDLVLSGMTSFKDLDENLKIAEKGFPDSLNPEEKMIIREVKSSLQAKKTDQLYSVWILYAMFIGCRYSWQLSTA